jgi:DNA-binding NtrC family response regulator
VVVRPRDLIRMEASSHERPTQVLVVDDEAQIVSLICEGLTIVEMVAMPATSVADAVRLLDRMVFDVVITDLRLPARTAVASWPMRAATPPAPRSSS